jgi:hypothetical protein
MTKCCNFHIADVFLVYNVEQGQMKRLPTWRGSASSLGLIHDLLFCDCHKGTPPHSDISPSLLPLFQIICISLCGCYMKFRSRESVVGITTGYWLAARSKA